MKQGRKPPKAAIKSLTTLSQFTYNFSQIEKEKLLDLIYMAWNIDGIELSIDFIEAVNEKFYEEKCVLELVEQSQKDGDGYVGKIVEFFKNNF